MAAPGSDAEIIDGSKTTLRATARALPRLLALALRLGRQADRRALAVLLGCAVASAAAQAFGLLATTGMITQLVAGTGSVADRLNRSIPSVAFLAAMSGTAALLRIASEWAAERIGPKIARAAELELIDAATRAEVVAYDNPRFQAAWDAGDRGAGATRDLLSQTRDVIGYTANLTAAGIVIATIHPVLFPLLVVAVIPQALARTAAANAFYRAMMATFGATRAANVLRWYLCDRRSAAEVRSTPSLRSCWGSTGGPPPRSPTPRTPPRSAARCSACTGRSRPAPGRSWSGAAWPGSSPTATSPSPRRVRRSSRCARPPPTCTRPRTTRRPSTAPGCTSGTGRSSPGWPVRSASTGASPHRRRPRR
ncbi:hypothetical protein ACFQ0M_03180 [Kitasatospora aburaviensis]